MKKTALFLALALSATMATPCLAAEANASSFASASLDGSAAAEKAAAAPQSSADESESATNIAVGKWYPVAREGESVPISTYLAYYLYPDGTVTDNDGSLVLSATIADDGSFTVDTSTNEEASQYTVSGVVAPVSQEDMDRFGVDDSLSYVDYSSNQLILTLSYPDPSNPLATSPAVTTVYFLRGSSQADFVQNYLFGKTWKIGDNTLTIDAEGKLDLNDGSSTGEASVYNGNDNTSLYIPAEIAFRWDDGGKVTYVPVLMTADEIQLQNTDNLDEVISLELVKDEDANAQANAVKEANSEASDSAAND